MAHHDLPPMSEDELSFAEPAASGQAAQPFDKLEAQLESSRRLNEYYNQVVAEIRASLEEIGEGDGHAS